MNDVNCIIISSDEESNANNLSKTQDVSYIDKVSAEVVELVDDDKKQNSMTRSDQLDQVKCSESPIIDGISYFSSNESQHGDKIGSQALKSSKSFDLHDKSELKLNGNQKIDDPKNIKMSNTFTKFLQLVLSMEEREEDRVKLLNKITKYHNLTDPIYLKSDELKNLLENSMNKLSKDPAFLYFVVKEVLDCLLSKRALIQCRQVEKMKYSEARGEYEGVAHMKDICVFYVDDEKNYKTVKKLSKVLRKLEKMIGKLEEAEVDLSDEEDSAYLKMQRYRERYCQIYKKLCKCTKQKVVPKNAHSHKITFSGSKNLRLDRAIENWLNKTKQFPDYASVLKFLMESSEELELNMSKEKIKELAVDIFVKIGKSLQLRRKYDLWDSLNAFLDNKVDPSVNDVALREKLDSNFQIAVKKEREVLNYYADLHVKQGLQPVEVPDEEADQSPVESGDGDEKELEAVERELSSKIPVEIDSDCEESITEGSDQENCASSVLSNSETENEDSTKSELSSNSECVPNCSDKDESDQAATANMKIQTKSKNCVVKPVGENGERRESAPAGVKRVPDTDRRREVIKKAKITTVEHSVNDDSDCELVLLSDEETNNNSEKDENVKIRKVHQINYAFINNSFNHNATLTDDLVPKRKNTSFSFKSGKAQRRFLQRPLADLTNVKHIKIKYMRIKNEKKRFQEINRLHLFDRSRFRYSRLIHPGKMNNQCALQNESGGNNTENQNNSESVNEKEACGESSKGDAISAPNNGGSGGGNGRDNNDDENKKPSDQKKRFEENQTNEDEDDETENGKEDKNEEKEKKNRCSPDGTVPDPPVSNSCDGDPIKNLPESENNECRLNSSRPIKVDSISSSQQGQKTTPSDPPKTKQVIPGVKKRQNSRIRVQRKGLSSTSKLPSPKHGFSSKQHEDTVKTTTPHRSRQTLRANTSEDDSHGSHQKKPTTPVKMAKSDEEIVNNFLQHSPPSISIKSPRNRPIAKKPSPSVLQAIQTLRRLKGITTTLVKASGPEREEDIVVIGESSRTPEKRSVNPSTPKPSQNLSFPLPKIVTVQGNVSGFEDMGSDSGNADSPSSKSPSSRRRRYCAQTRGTMETSDSCNENTRKARTPQKNVEYVILE